MHYITITTNDLLNKNLNFCQHYFIAHFTDYRLSNKTYVYFSYLYGIILGKFVFRKKMLSYVNCFAKYLFFFRIKM